MIEEDPQDFDLRRATTIRDAAEEFGVAENAIYQWIHREKIKSIGVLPDRRKVFLHVDLARAEQKFRDRAPDRGDPMIAGLQALKRAQRAAARTRTAA